MADVYTYIIILITDIKTIDYSKREASVLNGKTIIPFQISKKTVKFIELFEVLRGSNNYLIKPEKA